MKIGDIAFRIYVHFRSEKVEQAMAWVNYNVGFNGNGPSDLNKKPAFDYPKLPQIIEREMQTLTEVIKEHRQAAWAAAVLEVIGESVSDYDHANW